MSRSLFSSNWYRVAGLKPRLRGHTRIHRQMFFGEAWYVLQDRQNGRFHRVSPSANLMLCLMDGRRTVDDIWQVVCARFHEDPPTQDDAIQLMAQLHSADLLQGGATPDVVELADRAATNDRRQLISKLRNPLAMRAPIFDPDRFLRATLPLVRPLFTVWGFLLWCGLLVSATILAALNYSTLSHDVVLQGTDVQNIMLIAMVYPVIKLLHEMGHAYATKVWGGEVHEFGLLFLVFIPLPYVDASASAAFREKWRRAVVGGAGIMVELLLAAIAMVIWVNAEPGIVRALALNVMLIGGVSTLVFNGNPLLRFDGYYIFQDLIEIPNLGARANRYFFYVIQRYLFGARTVDSPATHAGERGWLFLYALLSGVYRVGVTVGIAMFVATAFFFVGVAIAVWVFFSAFLLPLGKGLIHVASSSQLSSVRRRAILVTGGFVALAVCFLFVSPIPYGTVAQGVVWVPEGSHLRAQTDGMMLTLDTVPGSSVLEGARIATLDDPSLDAQTRIHLAQVDEVEIKLAAARVIDRVQTDLLEAQIRHIEGRLATIQQRQRDLVVRSPVSGRLILPHDSDLVGRFFRRGDLMGYVVGHEDTVLRVVVPQSRIDLVRSRTEKVEVRFAEAPGLVRSARILRETPAARLAVPSSALTTDGGGDIPVDPKDPQRLKTLQALFILDLQLVEDHASQLIGGRAYVRFDHGVEPPVWRFGRELRQVFLSRFGV